MNCNKRIINIFSSFFISFSCIIFLFFSVSGCKSKSSTANSSTVTAARVSEIIIDSVAMMNYLIVDLRGRMDYVRGHLGPAIWLSMDSLDLKLRTFPKDKHIVVYDSTGLESPKALQIFAMHGFKHVLMLEGGTKHWIEKGYPMAVRLVENTSSKLEIQKKDISLEELFKIVKENDKDYAILDVRSFDAFNENHIKGAISLPYIPVNVFVVMLAELNFPKDKPLIVYCVGHTCNSSDMAIDVLLRNNYTNVYLLRDGIEGWMSRNYPIEKK